MRVSLRFTIFPFSPFSLRFLPPNDAGVLGHYLLTAFAVYLAEVPCRPFFFVPLFNSQSFQSFFGLPV